MIILIINDNAKVVRLISNANEWFMIYYEWIRGCRVRELKWSKNCIISLEENRIAMETCGANGIGPYSNTLGSPCEAKMVLRRSNGYDPTVAAHPANAPLT